MVIVTVGEMIVVPVSQAFVAQLHARVLAGGVVPNAPAVRIPLSTGCGKMILSEK